MLQPAVTNLVPGSRQVTGYGLPWLGARLTSGYFGGTGRPPSSPSSGALQVAAVWISPRLRGEAGEPSRQTSLAEVGPTKSKRLARFLCE